MASVTITNTVHTSVTVTVNDLQYNPFEYANFRFVFSQNGTQILNFTQKISTGGSTFDLVFANANYLGNNWFAPATMYSLNVYATYGGTEFAVNTTAVSFTTNSISAPTSTITPSVYPTTKNQGSYGNCVAMSLSTAMEIFKAKAMGYSSSYENFSVSYIYGSDGGSGEYMSFEAAVNNCISYGSPRWELIVGNFPDSKDKSTSVNLFNGASQFAKDNAAKQRFSGSSNIDFYDCASVQNAISTYGYFMLNIRIPNNLYSIGSDGIVPQPSGGWSGAGHSFALIGLTTINGKKYWVAQNSWGTSWGLNGRCYIPFDWGCGVQSPMTSSNTNQTTGWTCESYSVWNNSISTANPSAPTGLTATQVDKTTNVNVSWGNANYVLVYARPQGGSEWFPKPSYGSYFTGSSGQVSMSSNEATYELMAIAALDNILSPQTNYITIHISSKTDFAWDVPKSVGSNTITAAEWNKLIAFIQSKRGSFTVTNAAVGNSLSAAMYNQLINGMGASSSYLVSAGQAITAAKLNSLVTLANSL